MQLTPYLRPELVLHVQSVGSRDDLFHQLGQAAASLVPHAGEMSLYQRLMHREAQMPTSTPDGVAFPHAVAPEIDQSIVAAARVVEGVNFGAPDHPPSDLILCMFGSSESPWEHVQLLARLARIVHAESSRENLRSATSAAELLQKLQEEDRAHE